MSRAPEFGIKPTTFETIDIHVRAGRRHAKGRSVRRCRHGHVYRFDANWYAVRKDVAMTGEVTCEVASYQLVV